ncbi:hypothetical protein TUMSATVNIG1_17920 [Vibrio nigripulchritudo]|uniref:DarT1-associated NADAR antitoxin family protein n=1 Tax=Vibrio nigripulchritudo TaxID=28173 RepID=UPI00190DFCAE|nr:hypothetical protein [Vibrio nigripulchritudo]BCL69837.1 hypothetical protein VNTUMSATTG_17740 [Vibrio nigripulchritudo]BDU31183.1 hypothetical protein TUMSATVNIG1_17920 [Vibrio nigripulchritudo]
MATRPIFIPETDDVCGAKEKLVDFKWFSGFAKSQKQKSIVELHSTARTLGFEKVLEVSSKSEDELGICLSAFNLTITTPRNNNRFTVETAFQGSKVFAKGGPYKDLFGMDSLAAKKDIRLKESGNLIAFEFYDKKFPLEPKTFFYDWLYINALVQNKELADSVVKYDCFTDIEFNPQKSINCQAHAVALYVSLHKHNQLETALSSPSDFLSILSNHYNKQKRNVGAQSTLI